MMKRRSLGARDDAMRKLTNDNIPQVIPASVRGYANGLAQVIANGQDMLMQHAGLEELTPDMSIWALSNPQDQNLSVVFLAPRIESGTISHSPTTLVPQVRHDALNTFARQRLAARAVHREDGVEMPTRRNIVFVGPGVRVIDDPDNDRTIVVIGTEPEPAVRSLARSSKIDVI